MEASRGAAARVQSFFEVQPPSCRQPLEPRPVRSRSHRAGVIHRVLACDPAPFYARIAATADPKKRIQTRATLTYGLLFPAKGDGFCDCGCGAALSGRQRRWAAASCAEFAWMVYAVIAGRRSEIKACLRAYWGRRCSVCRTVPARVPGGRRGKGRSGMEWDHIIPVHRGGGACWLGNYRPLCTGCHKEKTAGDRRARQAVRGIMEPTTPQGTETSTPQVANI